MDNHFLKDYDEIALLWEQRVDDNGAFYYINSEHEISWIHPYLDKVLKDTGKDFAEIKYAAYRTALKIRNLQLRLGLSFFTIDATKKAFPVPDEQATSITNHDFTHEQALMLIKIALHTSDVDGTYADVHNKVADLVLALIIEIYDKSHSGRLVSRCIQNALVALCSARLGEKYKLFCSRSCDHAGKLSRDKLILLIDDLMQIPSLLKESKAFGVDVVAAVDSCFGTSNNKCSDSVSESCFYAWLFLEPQTLVWLPTLHRAIAAEKVQHDAQCSSCRIHPIFGFRYRCLLCYGYSLCQNCFLLGQHSFSHTLHHPVKEYCLPMTALESTKVWLITVTNKLFCRRRQQTETAYLPVLERTDQRVVLDWEYGSIQVDLMASFGPLGPAFDFATESTDWEDNKKQISKQDFDSGAVNEEETCTQARIPLKLLGGRTDSNTYSSEILMREPKPPSNQIDCDDYKVMAIEIEELKQENRLLMEKLQAYEKLSQIQRSSKEGASITETLQDTTTESFISPIAENSRNRTSVTGNNHGKSEQNTLAIIGAFTPVRGPPSASLLANPPSLLSQGNVIDETEADGLQYRSSDMSLLSHFEDSEHTGNNEWLQSAEVSVHQSAITNDTEAAYKPSDMSRLCLGLGKLSVEENNEVITSHSDNTENFHDSSIDDLRISESRDSKHDGIHERSQSLDAVTPSSVELSNIPSVSLGHGPVKLPSFLPTPKASAMKSRHRMLEPVHMSTPVQMVTKKARCLDTLTSSQKNQTLTSRTLNKTKDTLEDRENLPPQGGTPVGRISTQNMKIQNSKSGIVLTPDSLLKDHSCQQNSLDSQRLTNTDKKEMFIRDQKASCIGDSCLGLTYQKAELHQIMADFEKECKISDFSDNTRLMTANNSSVIAAAFSIGDVLAEFVQAVTKQEKDCNVSEVTETTHF